MIPQWPDFFPKWLVDGHTINASQSITRSDLPGHVEQLKRSHRSYHIATAKLYLSGIQSPMFEYFIRDLCNEGVAWFQGYIVTKDGLVSAKCRIVDGAYTKTITNRGAFVSCNLDYEM